MTNESIIKLGENEIDKLRGFEKSLGRFFFADCKVLISPSCDEIVCLNIHMSSDFSLPEAISLLLMPYVKDYRQTNFTQSLLCFKKMITKLKNNFDMPVDITELAIYFQNTDVIIHRINENSIIEEIREILSTLICHFDHYANSMGEIPFEIHIPVIEDPTYKKCTTVLDTSKILPVYESPYFKYWGLYFNSLRKPVIYDLNNTSIIQGGLDLSFD
ncbi:MAG: hypothetical protein ACFCUL_12790 [Flavobacteriaceae bacterium]